MPNPIVIPEECRRVKADYATEPGPEITREIKSLYATVGSHTNGRDIPRFLSVNRIALLPSVDQVLSGPITISRE